MNRYEKFCGVLVLVFAAAIVTIGQAAKIPVLSGDDKVAILTVQKQLLQATLQMKNLEAEYQNVTAQQSDLSKRMNDLIQKAEHDNPGFKLNLDTLEFQAPPAPAKKP